MPNFESSEKIESTILGGEATFSFKPDKSYEKFVEQMKNELSTVDIIDWPAQMIEKLLGAFRGTRRLVTRNPQHYQYLQTEDGYTCVAGNDDTLFGVPIVLDKRGKIKAAQVGVERKGGDMSGGERNRKVD